MTHFQALQILRAAGIVMVRKELNGPRLVLTFKEGATERDMLLSQYKAALQEQIKGFDEQRQEVTKNMFAARIMGEFSLGGGNPMKMEVLKKNEQLSRDERIEKTQRLMEIDNELKKRRGMLQVLSHLQVHQVELLPEFLPKKVVPVPTKGDQTLNGKAVWNRGVKFAVLYCLSESKKAHAADEATFEICKKFLETYAIPEDPDYTPEQLFNNLRQIRLLEAHDS
jgi:hypothetical protein